MYFKWTGAQNNLPRNVRLLTLEQFLGEFLLLRLEHFYELDEDAELSKPATVSLRVNVFKFHLEQNCIFRCLVYSIQQLVIRTQ